MLPAWPPGAGSPTKKSGESRLASIPFPPSSVLRTVHSHSFGPRSCARMRTEPCLAKGVEGREEGPGLDASPHLRGTESSREPRKATRL